MRTTPLNDGGKPVTQDATSRRTLLKFALGLAGLAAAGTTEAVARQASEQPNFILILTDDLLTSQVDLAPTFAEWNGATAPAFVDDRSLASILAGDPVPVDWRQATLIEDAESEFDENGRKPSWVALRGTEFLYTSYNTGEQELYGMRVDPYETENLAASIDPETLAALADRTRRMHTCQAETCRSIESEPLPPQLLPAS